MQLHPSILLAASARSMLKGTDKYPIGCLYCSCATVLKLEVRKVSPIQQRVVHYLFFISIIQGWVSISHLFAPMHLVNGIERHVALDFILAIGTVHITLLPVALTLFFLL